MRTDCIRRSTLLDWTIAIVYGAALGAAVFYFKIGRAHV